MWIILFPLDPQISISFILTFFSFKSIELKSLRPQYQKSYPKSGLSELDKQYFKTKNKKFFIKERKKTEEKNKKVKQKKFFTNNTIKEFDDENSNLKSEKEEILLENLSPTTKLALGVMKQTSEENKKVKFGIYGMEKIKINEEIKIEKLMKKYFNV